MATLDHLTGIKCPQCGVNLFRASDPVSGEIVFCSICLAGGDHKQVVEHGANLTRPFLTRQSADDFLRKIRPGGE